MTKHPLRPATFVVVYLYKNMRPATRFRCGSRSVEIPKQNQKQNMHCPLKIDNNHGLIFSSSVTPISGTVNIELKNKLDSYAIIILDKNSNEVFRKSLRSDGSSSRLETSFTWDLKSRSDSFVESGCYVIRLIDASNESKEIECCSIECRVVDTRNILSIARSLKRYTFAPNASRTLFSVYFDIIEDVQGMILERLKNNRFDEPYFVACITACFIQEIADDIQNQSKSRFLDLFVEFQSKNSVSEQQQKSARLGLWALFDFLINYMSGMEDYVRAKAMAKCGQCHLTQNDKAQIVSSLVSAIYPHCKTVIFPKNVVGGIVEKIIEGIIKFGIKYMSTRHINKSISICQTLPLGNPCDVVIR